MQTTLRTFLSLLFLTILCTCVRAQIQRYTTTVFPGSDITSNVVYGQAPFLNFPYSNENNTSMSDLVMDVYTPENDNNTARAAIIFAHAGGFITGDRTHDDMVALCDSFARKGYVTATIDYRQGFYLFANVDLHGTRAVYRGIQDGRSAVRFLRANAAAYGIDPDQVYLAGSSAGAFISLHSIYLTEVDEIPTETGINTYTDILFSQTSPDLGLPDVGDNLSFSGTPNGVISLWGAVASLDMVDASDNQPIYLAHGTDDSTVPFNQGPPFSFGAFPDVFGNNLINDQLDAYGTADHETYFVPGAEHEFYGTDNGTWANGSGPNAYWDTLLPRMEQFLWRQHMPTADFGVSIDDLTASFTDQSSGALEWFWDFGDGATSQVANPNHTYSEDGDYSVRLFIHNDILSWDTLRQTVTVSEAALPLTWSGAPSVRHDGKNNWLNWKVSEQVNVSHFEVEYSRFGADFNFIGRVGALPFTNREISYDFEHDNPSVGSHYYRLNAVDHDGSFSYSRVVFIETEAALLAVPNPSNGIIQLVGLTQESTTADIYDAAGRSYGQVKINGAKADLRHLRPGLYILRLPSSGEMVRVVLM